VTTTDTDTGAMTDEQLFAQMFNNQGTDEQEAEGSAPETEEPDEVNIGADEDTDEDEQSFEGEEPSDDEGDEEGVDEVEGDDGEQLVEVKVDGQTRKIPLREALDDYSGRASLNARHNQLKEAEAIAGQNAQALQQHVQRVMQLSQLAEAGMLSPRPQPPNEDDFQNDPIGAIEADRRYNREMQKWQQQQGQIQSLMQVQQQQEQAVKQSYLQEQKRILVEEFPEETKSPEAARAFMERLSTAAQKHYGIPPESLHGVTDAAVVKALNDAIKYRELQGTDVRKTPKAEPRTVTKKRGRVQTNTLQRQKQMAKALRSQDPDDFLPLMFET
jgi:hypothetical protein